MTDWLDQTHAKNLIVERVSPNNIDEVIGELEGVDRGSSTIECGYYTDTRTSASLTVVGDSYERNQFLRPIVEIPDLGYRRELGLYLVKADPASRPMSQWVYELELQSMLYGLSTDISGSPWAISTNGKALTAMRQMLEKCNRTYLVKDANDYVFKSPKAFEVGTSYLTRLYGLTEQSDNRLDVDGHGRVTIGKYVNPTAKAPVVTLDVNDPRGIIQALSRSTDYLSIPGRVVVHCKYSETANNKTVEKEVIGQAEANGSSSPNTRGYTVTDYRDVPDLSPKTVTRANQLAQEYLNRAVTELVEWEVETPYIPVWEGDVVELVVHDGLSGYRGTRRCLVKNMSIELLHFGITMTLKEVGSGDWERE